MSVILISMGNKIFVQSLTKKTLIGCHTLSRGQCTGDPAPRLSFAMYDVHADHPYLMMVYVMAISKIGERKNVVISAHLYALSRFVAFKS